MIVCICHGVNDGKIREIVRSGASTVAKVTQRCGAGGDCGACRKEIKQLINENQVVAGSSCSGLAAALSARHEG